MTVYNLDNTIHIGKPVKRVIDANGLEWFRTMEVDTETGRIVYQKMDNEGFLLIDPRTESIVLEEVQTAAPVQVIFEGESDFSRGLGNGYFRYEGCVCNLDSWNINPSCPLFWKHEERRVSALERRTLARYRLPCSVFRIGEIL